MSRFITLNRIYQFSSSHRLHSSDLSDQENVEVYDKCNNYHGHGHDYRLEVSVSGEPDLQTGMIISLETYDRKVHEVIDQLDYKNLDKEVPYFADNLSTGEVIIRFLWEELAKKFNRGSLFHLKLWETNNNYFELGLHDV